MNGTDPWRNPGSYQRLAQLWRERGVAVKAMSFGAVGVVNSLVDLGVFSFCYYVLALPIVLANIMSWSIAVSGSYVMNSQVTFAAESGRRLSLAAYGAFVISQVAGFFANTVTVLVASYVVPVLVAKVIAIGASFVVNFTLSHFVVFRERK